MSETGTEGDTDVPRLTDIYLQIQSQFTCISAV